MGGCMDQWVVSGQMTSLIKPELIDIIQFCLKIYDLWRHPHLWVDAVADLHNKILDVRPPWGSKFFQFHAVFGKIKQNRMLAPPRVVGAPFSGKSWICHWDGWVNGWAHVKSLKSNKF